MGQHDEVEVECNRGTKSIMEFGGRGKGTGSGFFILRDADWFSWNNAAMSSKRVHLSTNRLPIKFSFATIQPIPIPFRLIPNQFS